MNKEGTQMAEIQLPNNSNKAKHEAELAREKNRLDEPAITKKQNGADMTKSFVAEVGGAFLSNLVKNIILPSFMDFVHDTLSDTLDSIFDKKGSSKRRKYVSYEKYSEPTRDQDRDYTRAIKSRSLSYDEILYKTREEAQEVLMMLRDDIEETKEHVATVSDLFDHSRLQGPFNGSDFGWTNLDNAYISREGKYWTICLPKARELQ
jgi:hypothetical protein